MMEDAAGVEVFVNEQTVHNTPVSTILSSVFFCLFSLLAACGNAVVIFVFLSQVNLRSSSTNMYLASLALSDLIVAILVMPLGIVQHVYAGVWIFGRTTCDLWHATDVCASTASILNLCVIAIERYEAISDPIRHQAASSKRTIYRLCGIWVLSALISYPAIIWWHLRLPEHLVRHQIIREEVIDAFNCVVPHNGTAPIVSNHTVLTNMTDDTARAHKELLCEFTDDPYYLIASSMISYYVPCILMISVYSAVYRTAVRVQNSYQMGTRTVNGASSNAIVLRVHRGRAQLPSTKEQCKKQCDNNVNNEECRRLCNESNSEDSRNHSCDCGSNTKCSCKLRKNGSRHASVKSSAKSVKKLRFHKFTGFREQVKRLFREQKAAKTLGLIMAVFCICWTPFFVCNLLIAFQSLDIIRETISKEHEELVMTIVTWFGYASSGLNPFIYCFTLREFRVALLAKICCCQRQLLNRKASQSSKAQTQALAQAQAQALAQTRANGAGAGTTSSRFEMTETSTTGCEVCEPQTASR